MSNSVSQKKPWSVLWLTEEKNFDSCHFVVRCRGKHGKHFYHKIVLLTNVKIDVITEYFKFAISDLISLAIIPNYCTVIMPLINGKVRVGNFMTGGDGAGDIHVLLLYTPYTPLGCTNAYF